MCFHQRSFCYIQKWTFVVSAFLTQTQSFSFWCIDQRPVKWTNQTANSQTFSGRDKVFPKDSHWGFDWFQWGKDSNHRQAWSRSDKARKTNIWSCKFSSERLNIYFNFHTISCQALPIRCRNILSKEQCPWSLFQHLSKPCPYCNLSWWNKRS